ncbi:MAG: IS21 family transposase, partial [Chloroflexota bacterium]
MYRVEDWAEVHRLFHREGLTKTVIARRLAMSRTTVIRLLALREPPRYRRPATGSQLDPFHAEIAAMLDADPAVAATVVRERLQRAGYSGGISILKAHLARVRPEFLAARAFQRTSYLPGEIVQVDWWHTGIAIPVGKELSRAAFGLVATLPHSGAHAVVFTLGLTMADFLAALPGCLARLGGVAEKLVCDNDASIVARREGGRARLHPEVAALLGALRCRPVVLKPRRPQSKGHAERTIGYLETSFVPLRTFADLADLQAQHDAWAPAIAFRRVLRRTGVRVIDRWSVERQSLHRLPVPLPDTDLRLEARAGKDAFVRVCGVDYSVPPAFVGRRVAARVSPTQVRLSCEGTEIAVHRRSFVPADVVLAAAHGRAIRLAREARDRLVAGDPELP